MKKVVVAVSGGGRSLKNLLQYQQEKSGFEVCGVIASRHDCGGAKISENAGLPLYVEPFTGNGVKASPALEEWLESVGAGLIVLAGFLKIFPVIFPGKPDGYTTINIHPSLLPAYGGKGLYGMRVHRAVIAAGDKISGASIHYVNKNYDEGSVIAQAKVPVLESDSPETLAARVFEAECHLLPETVRLLSESCGSLP